MQLKRNFVILEVIGMWPDRKNSVTMVAVLQGTNHSFSDMTFQRTVYCRASKNHFDLYKLEKGWKIKR